MCESKPKAWIVKCPSGHEFDELIFADLNDAQNQTQAFVDDIDIQGMSPDEICAAAQAFEPSPLYSVAAAQESLSEWQQMLIETRKLAATHRCKVCEALWIDHGDMWSLASETCGPCCDNAEMGDQIEPIGVYAKLSQGLDEFIVIAGDVTEENGILTLKVAELEQHINAMGGFHARTPREAEISEALEATSVEDRDPSEHAIAELLMLVDAGRNRLWKAEEQVATLSAKVRELEQQIWTMHGDMSFLTCAATDGKNWENLVSCLKFEMDQNRRQHQALCRRSSAIERAASNLIADVRQRHPGEDLYCPLMVALDTALAAKEDETSHD